MRRLERSGVLAPVRLNLASVDHFQAPSDRRAAFLRRGASQGRSIARPGPTMTH